MRKKILIGSMLVLTLLLLMPSIPAIQQKTIEGGIKQEIQEKLETIDFKDLKEIKALEDDMKFPILYILISLFVEFGLVRILFLYLFGGGMGGGFNSPSLQILCLLRAVMVTISTFTILYFFMFLSYILGWGWDL